MLLAQQRATREEGLKRSMLEDKEGRGYKMLRAMGWKGSGGLGRDAGGSAAATAAIPVPQGGGGVKEDAAESASAGAGGVGLGWRPPILEPIAVTVKEDRGGIGHLSSEQQRYRDAAVRILPGGAGGEGEFGSGVQKESTDTYRERIRLEREERKSEAQFYAAQKILEEFDRGTEGLREHDATEEVGAKDESARPRIVPIQSVPLLYRSLVKHREEKERIKREKYEFMESLSTATHARAKRTTLPGYDPEPEERVVFGQTAMVDDEYEDSYEEDAELEELKLLSYVERLAMITKELREQWIYCFWCKYRYASQDEMEESCPGLEEDLHG